MSEPQRLVVPAETRWIRAYWCVGQQATRL
jgi:hypothetical protein